MTAWKTRVSLIEFFSTELHVTIFFMFIIILFSAKFLIYLHLPRHHHHHRQDVHVPLLQPVLRQQPRPVQPRAKLFRLLQQDQSPRADDKKAAIRQKNVKQNEKNKNEETKKNDIFC